MSDRTGDPPDRPRPPGQASRERALVRAIARMYLDAAADMRAPIESLAGVDDRPMTPAERRRIEAAVDEPLATIFGPSRGEPGLLTESITRATTEAWERTLIEESEREAELLEGRIAAVVAAGDVEFAELLQMSRAGVATRLATAQALDTAQSWIGPDGLQLSDRIWAANKLVRQRINQELRLALVRGESPATAARRLEQYMTPGRVGGTLGGRGLYAANRLARTELARAHAEATVEAGRRIPTTRGVRWNLSNNHPAVDVCDQHATADLHRLGPGGHPLNDRPQLPAHPFCRCFWTRILPTREETDLYLRRRYGLDIPDSEREQREGLAAQLAGLTTGRPVRVTPGSTDMLSGWPNRRSDVVDITPGKRDHYLKHPEMASLHREVIDTIRDPDIVRRDRKYGDRALFYRQVVGPQWMIVVFRVPHDRHRTGVLITAHTLSERDVEARGRNEEEVWRRGR